MEETQCCHKCGIGFKQVGLLSLEERLDTIKDFRMSLNALSVMIPLSVTITSDTTSKDNTMPDVVTVALFATGHVLYNMQQ